MSSLLKTQIKDYTKEMDINFFCILRRFINYDTMSKHSLSKVDVI